MKQCEKWGLVSMLQAVAELLYLDKAFFVLDHDWLWPDWLNRGGLGFQKVRPFNMHSLRVYTIKYTHFSLIDESC